MEDERYLKKELFFGIFFICVCILFSIMTFFAPWYEMKTFANNIPLISGTLVEIIEFLAYRIPIVYIPIAGALSIISLFIGISLLKKSKIFS